MIIKINHYYVFSYACQLTTLDWLSLQSMQMNNDITGTNYSVLFCFSQIKK